MRRPPFPTLALALATLSLAGCGGGPAPADSGSLAADLQRAAEAPGSDSLVPPPAAAPAAAPAGTPAGGPTDGAWVLGANGIPQRVARPAAPRPGTTTAATAPAAPTDTAPPTPAATGSGDTSWCASPRLADQQRCLRVYLTAYDARLNDSYQSLIAALRRQSGTPAGAPDPAAVQRLRASQRAWLVERDRECQRRGAGQEGRLWAPSRARCLGDEATRRAETLEAELHAADSAAAR